MYKVLGQQVLNSQDCALIFSRLGTGTARDGQHYWLTEKFHSQKQLLGLYGYTVLRTLNGQHLFYKYLRPLKSQSIFNGRIFSKGTDEVQMGEFCLVLGLIKECLIPT